MLAQRAQFHQARLTDHVSLYNPIFTEALKRTIADLMRGGMSYMSARNSAVGLIYMKTLEQANVLSFVDVFWVLAVLIVALIPVVFIMRRPPRHAPPVMVE